MIPDQSWKTFFNSDYDNNIKSQTILNNTAYSQRPLLKGSPNHIKPSNNSAEKEDAPPGSEEKHINEAANHKGCCCCSAQVCWWEPPRECLPLDFCRDTGLHGLKYISQPQRHITERVFWLFSFMIGMSAAVYLISDVWRKYQENPVIVSFEAYETSIDAITFPAVTLCNMNKVLKSKAETYIKKAQQVQMDLTNLSTLDALSNLYFLDHVCSTSKSFSKSFNFSSNVGAVDQGLLDFTKELEYALHGSVEQFLIESSQTCTEMIKLCLWKGEPRDCSDLFRPIETDFGKCCTFNMIPTSLLHRFTNDTRDDPEMIEEWSQWDQDEDWGFVEASEDLEYPRRQLKAGKTSGLSIMLDPNLDEYFCATSDSRGFRLSVHQPMDFPHVLDYGHAIEPDTETFLSIRSEINKAGAGLHRVPLKTLHYFSKYTSNNCVDECLANLTFTNCLCVRYFMPRKPGVRLCGPQNFECAESVKQRAYRYGVKKICDACLPVCTEIEYQIESSMTTMQNGYNIWVDDANISASWSNRNVSIVHIYFGQESTYARVRKELYGQTDLIANTGGLLGLCLGFSGLSLMEVLYFLTLRLWCRRRRKRHIVSMIANKFVGLWRKARQNRNIKDGRSSLAAMKNGWVNERNLNQNQQERDAPSQALGIVEHARTTERKMDHNMTNSPFFIITHELQQMQRNLMHRSRSSMRQAPPPMYHGSFGNGNDVSENYSNREVRNSLQDYLNSNNV